MTEVPDGRIDPLRNITDFGGEDLDTVIAEEIATLDIYQAACAEGTQRVYRANVIVVGQGGIGKTHLCRNLLGEEFTEDDPVTNGIEVSGCILEKHTAGTSWQRKESSANYCIEALARGFKEYRETRKTNKTTVRKNIIDGDEVTVKQVLEKSQGQPDVPDLLTLWDFGGQYVFYTTHQTFLTWRAVYLLVFDLTKELNDPVYVERVGRTGPKPVDSVPDTVGDFLKFWQNSIHTHTEIVKRKDPGLVDICPRILLVGTHRDQLGKTEEERVKLTKEKFRKIQEFLDGRPAHDMHVQPYFYAVNNCDQQDAGIKELKGGIWETIHAQPHWGEEQPLRYVHLEKRLKEMSTSRKCLSLEDVFQEGKRYGFDVAENVLFFLGFYSELGELVFFNEVGISEIVILDPQWLIDAFASLITVEKYHKVSKPEVRGYWKMLDDRGELDERLIDSVWEQDAELKGNKQILLRICQRFDLLVELPEEQANEKWKKYLVPCVLKKPTQSRRLFENAENSSIIFDV
ncbi:probable serine/threonine-protein kinase pats1 [Lingula anatina]|uniref:Probable serine/threonine-protein kinase pats1 n=1 Tax=Lingula anatina TaxID=7574 RepID=A0A1S3K879_LINAN|nr:probable serine/threonine-protein kinase pats1 [Lingula anatina]|eukprot:XP_013418702.1 probable serine/threonine-protein kinase pats1 [Lingula anatina]